MQSTRILHLTGAESASAEGTSDGVATQRANPLDGLPINVRRDWRSLTGELAPIACRTANALPNHVTHREEQYLGTETPQRSGNRELQTVSASATGRKAAETPPEHSAADGWRACGECRQATAQGFGRLPQPSTPVVDDLRRSTNLLTFYRTSRKLLFTYRQAALSVSFG